MKQTPASKKPRTTSPKKVVRKKPPTKQLHKRVRRAVKNTVVPHKKNNYRPHLIRRWGILAVLVTVLLLQMGYNFLQTGSVLGQTTEVTAAQLLANTNRERVAHSASPLALNDKLSHAAYLKAQDMFDKQYWSHDSPTGATPWKWFESADYSYTRAGENLAKGFHSSPGVITAWMDSQEHRHNVLDTSFQDVGFAVVTGSLNGEKTTVVVALYGTPKTNAQLASNTSRKQTVLAAQDENIGIVSRIGIGLQSMTPALLGTVVLLLFVTFVAVFAHMNRKKLPKPLRQSWYRHHGLYKALGTLSLVVLFVALYGGGQI